MLHYELFYATGPSDEWVVFLHGAGGSTKTWSYQLEDFRGHFNLLLIDLRDHGRSKDIQPPFKSYQFSIISEDIKQVLDRAGITKAHFITLSFGSVLVQDLYMRYPELVDRLIIAGGIFKGNVFIRA
ncbi:MAG: alpha/beta hydrolase, partial [Cytophagales bacterium]|nr:alpha/beta hydrolase [Cytophagales bacterium]